MSSSLRSNNWCMERRGYAAKCKRNVSPSPSTCVDDLLPGLTRDLAILCLARLPRSALLPLRLLSKAWRKTLEGDPLFYKARVELCRTQEWLYVQCWNSRTRIISWFAFDTMKGKWLPLPQMPKEAGRYRHVFGTVSAVIGPHLYVLGGRIGYEGPTVRDVFVYSAMSNRWSRGSSMLSGRHSPIIFVLKGNIYVLGGFDSLDQPVETSECYNVENDLWTIVESKGHPKLPTPAKYNREWQPKWQQHTSANDDMVCSYRADGASAGPVISLRYDPEAGEWVEILKNASVEERNTQLQQLQKYLSPTATVFVPETSLTLFRSKNMRMARGERLHEIDWVPGTVTGFDNVSSLDWIHVRGLGRRHPPWVAFWMTNPDTLGIGSKMYIVKNRLRVMVVELQREESQKIDELPRWDHLGVEHLYVIHCQLLAM